MYLAIDPETTTLVFSILNPRHDGFHGTVECEVSIDVPEGINEWRNGARAPEPCVGVSEANEKEYRVFRSDSECRQQGFSPIGAAWDVVESWKEWKGGSS